MSTTTISKPQCWKNCWYAVPIENKNCCISSKINKESILPKTNTLEWGAVSVVNNLEECEQCKAYFPKMDYQIKRFNNFDREDFLHDDDR